MLDGVQLFHISHLAKLFAMRVANQRLQNHRLSGHLTCECRAPCVDGGLKRCLQAEHAGLRPCRDADSRQILMVCCRGPCFMSRRTTHATAFSQFQVFFVAFSSSMLKRKTVLRMHSTMQHYMFLIGRVSQGVQNGCGTRLLHRTVYFKPCVNSARFERLGLLTLSISACSFNL